MAAKKKKSKSKKGGGWSPREAFDSEATRALILNAAIIAAVGGAVFAAAGALGEGRAFAVFALASAAGLLAGFTGNPALVVLPERAAERFGVGTAQAADFPSAVLEGFLSPEAMIFAAAVVMAAVVARDGLKKGWFRYEPALIVPGLGLAGMAAAAWAKGAGSLFYELFSGFFSNAAPVWFIAGALGLFGAARWLGGWNPSRRHWMWSAVAGPAVGFWAGYVEVVWIQALVALLFFVYLLVLNEDEPGMAAGVPFAFVPLCAAKLFFVDGGMSAAGPHVADMQGAPWAMFACAAAGFALSSLLAARLLVALPAKAARHVFFPLFFASIILMMILL
jgi:hypothetical protein